MGNKDQLISVSGHQTQDRSFQEDYTDNKNRNTNQKSIGI